MIPKEMCDVAAAAMEAKRRELIAQPLARIWPELAEAAIAALLPMIFDTPTPTGDRKHPGPLP